MKSPIVKFLCRCAGANLKILRNYPTEFSKYSSAGATILFTGIFAALSGGYACYKIFNDIYYALALGLLWGVMIFNLDRYIVMSIKKRNNFFKELLTATPRIILAIIISLVVATPLEVRIFADRIAREIGDMELEQMMRERQDINTLYGIKEIKEAAEALEGKIEEGKSKEEKEPNGDQYNELKNRKSSLEQQILNMTTERKRLWGILSSFYSSYKWEVIEEGVFVTKTAKGIKDIPLDKQGEIIGTYNKRKNLVKKIKRLEDEVIDVNDQILSLTKKYYEDVVNDNNELSRQKKEQDSINRIVNEQLMAQTKKADSINKIAYSDNFVTQVEALGALTQYKKPIKDETGNIIKKADNTMYWMSMAIIILFIVIETAPIFVKLISSKGQYDIALEYESKLKEVKTARSTYTKMLYLQIKETVLAESQEKTIDRELEVFNEKVKRCKQKELEALESVSEEDLHNLKKEIKDYFNA